MPVVNAMEDDPEAVCEEIRVKPPLSPELTLLKVPDPSLVNIVFPPASLTVFVFTVTPAGAVTASPAAPRVTVVPVAGVIFLASKLLTIYLYRTL